jgi:hypothetical protein
MRLVHFSVVALLAVLGASRLHAQSTPTRPFGLGMGTPLATVRGELGGTQPMSSFNGWFLLQKVPSPSGPFRSFQLFVSPVSGLCSVVAISPNIESDPAGTEVRRAYSAVRDSLDTVYGKSSLLESVVRNPLYTGADEWMLSIHYRERTYRAIWNMSSGRFPSELSQVSLSLEHGSSESTAQLVLSVTRPDQRGCHQEVMAAERASP